MKLFGAFNIRDALPTGTARVLALLRIVDSTGGVTVVQTDTSWRVGSGGLLRNNIYLGVVFDAGLEQVVAGWQLPGFDDSSWVTAQLSTFNNIGMLQLQVAPPIRVTDASAPIAITAVPGTATSFTLKFPRNMAGVVQVLGVTTSTRWTINLTFAEITFSNNTINTVTNLAGGIGRFNGDFGPCAPLPAIERDTLTFEAGNNLTYTPPFTWHAFQYVQVDNWPVNASGAPSLAHFRALQFHTDNALAGSFVSWNPQFAAIDELAQQSFKSNWAGGIQSDCPGRYVPCVQMY